MLNIGLDGSQPVWIRFLNVLEEGTDLSQASPVHNSLKNTLVPKEN